MFGSKRGDSPIPLVLFIAFTLIMGAFTYNDYDKFTQVQLRLKNHDAEKMPPGKDMDILKQQKLSIVQEVTGISNLMGFGFQIGAGESIRIADVKETLKSFAGEKDDNQNYKYPALVGKIDFVEEEAIPVTLTLNLHTLIEALQPHYANVLEQNAILNSDVEKTRAYLDEERSQKDDRSSILVARIAALEEEINQINSKKAEMVTKLTTEKEEAYNVAREIKTQIEDVKKKNKRVLSQLRSKLSSQRQEIKILIRQRKLGKRPDKISSEKTAKLFKLSYEEPDGEIVYSDPITRLTHINIGSRKNVVKGLKFMVFRYGSERQIRYKGKVEVNQVEEDMSRVVILEELDKYDPIITGDYLLNPMWDAEHPKYIAFAGETFGSRFKVKDMIRFCEDIGAKVEMDSEGKPTVTVRTDILVAGGIEAHKTFKKTEGAPDAEGEDGKAAAAVEEDKKDFWWLDEDPNFKKALEMGLEVVRDIDFIQYVGD